MERIIAEIDFNRDDDKKEYGTDNRIVRVSRFKEDGLSKVGITFNLGRREDDAITLVFGVAELAIVIASCEEE